MKNQEKFQMPAEIKDLIISNSERSTLFFVFICGLIILIFVGGYWYFKRPPALGWEIFAPVIGMILIICRHWLIKYRVNNDFYGDDKYEIMELIRILQKKEKQS
jgi:hypothetical protein